MIAFRGKAIKMGLCSLATAVLIARERLQRETDIFLVFDVSPCHANEGGLLSG